MKNFKKEVQVFAPATISNLGPGFDVLGAALDSRGDTVVARMSDKPGVHIVKIEGDEKKLPREANKNTAGISATEVVRQLDQEKIGVELELKKGLPLGSGLGSSAASAVAGASAVAHLFDRAADHRMLMKACLKAEAVVSGRHPDNIAPSLLGGIIMIRESDPLDYVSLPIPKNLYLSVVTPNLQISTRQARAILPRAIPMEGLVRNTANLAALVTAFHTNDLKLLSRSLTDHVVEPIRLQLIPGCANIKAAAEKSGALGCIISGSGPTLVAFCEGREIAQEVLQSMQEQFKKEDVRSEGFVSTISSKGARVLS